MKITTLNIKDNYPACDEALAKVLTEIKTHSFGDVKVVKIIHGYGSRGKGGSIKKELHSMLKTLKNQGKIEDFVPNEQFSSSNTIFPKKTKLYPELFLDKDLANLNPGITLLFLK